MKNRSLSGSLAALTGPVSFVLRRVGGLITRQAEVMMKYRTLRGSSVLLLFCVISCGPVMSKQDRWVWTPYDDKEWTQERDDIIVENRPIQQFPPEFLVTVQQCSGVQLVVDSNNKPVTEQVSLLALKPPPGGSRYFQITITNNTDHVVRLNRAVFRLFDPSGNQYEPLSVDEMQAMMSARRPCPSTQQILPHYKIVKFYNRNVEIVPRSSFTGYVVFLPPAINVAGTWKLGVFDIPSKTDESGKVIKTTNFEVRSVAKHYVDHYFQENAFAQKQLKNSEEVQ